MKLLAIFVFASFLLTASTLHAQDVQFIDTEKIREKFETSLGVIKERLESTAPPRYFLNKAEISFSVTSGVDGNVEGKIPIAVVSVSFSGKYGQVKTRRETYTYVPRTSIPVSFEDLGVAAFLAGLHEKVAEKLKTADFIVTAAKHEEDFVIVLSGEGKLEFLSLLSFGADVQTSNGHKMTFHFCLLGNDGNCLE